MRLGLLCHHWVTHLRSTLPLLLSRRSICPPLTTLPRPSIRRVLGVNTLMQRLSRWHGRFPFRFTRWQGDDVGGFENTGAAGRRLGGNGCNYSREKRARRMSFVPISEKAALAYSREKAFEPACGFYAETSGKKVERDSLTAEHFSRWIDWAKTKKIGLDFNPSFFSHPLAADGFTLSSADNAVRQFWIRHGIAVPEDWGSVREKPLNETCITNVWIPDGYKDVPADRLGPRARLQQSLDDMFAPAVDPAFNKDALEGKLFGIGFPSQLHGGIARVLSVICDHAEKAAHTGCRALSPDGIDRGQALRAVAVPAGNPASCVAAGAVGFGSCGDSGR